MNLPHLLKRKTLTVLGLNSGTSADGLDLAVVRIARRGRTIACTFVDGTRRAYPAALRAEILKTADARTVELNELILLQESLGVFYGKSAASYMGKLHRRGVPVDLVAAHGQTVRHLPTWTQFAGSKVNATLQLGSLERISAETGRVAVGRFRQADVALGGEGAPITVAAMARLFGDRRESRLIVNIGGMANFFYFPAGAHFSRIEAADCGPGNSLCDILAQRLYGKSYDRGGKHALAGKVSQRLLSLLLADPFFTLRTVSTGRETFGPEMVQRMQNFAREFKLTADDLLATAAELTVISIAEAVWLYIDNDPRVKKLYLTGGGVHNKFFTRRLARVFENLKISSVQELGIAPGLVEAAAYAVMGEACVRSEARPTQFGERSSASIPVSGSIVQPPVTRR